MANHSLFYCQLWQMNDTSSFFEANRQGWNQRTRVHTKSAFYDVAGFKQGKSSLNQPELNALGDVSGKTLLHLQCHFGQDTLSWARAGAIVTGIDFSEEAISTAKSLAAELQLPAQFICCNVYDTLQHIQPHFDIVFTSYGVIGWLPDLDQWAQVISDALQPGGTFYMIEFHPVVWMLDDNCERITYPYYNASVIVTEQQGTYTDRNAPIQFKEYSWNHSISEVLNALIRHGLVIQEFNEYMYSCYNCFNNMVQGPDGYWQIKGLEDKLPMMFSVKAVKPV